MQHLDFTTVLPRFLSMYIFSFLEPKTLCRCAQVSWAWKFLSEQVQEFVLMIVIEGLESNSNCCVITTKESRRVYDYLNKFYRGPSKQGLNCVW